MKTITYDDTKWVLVPILCPHKVIMKIEIPIETNYGQSDKETIITWDKMLAAAPKYEEVDAI